MEITDKNFLTILLRIRNENLFLESFIKHYFAEGVDEIHILDDNSNIGILFGREKSGLSNFQISFADTIVEIPTSPEFSSLNLAQAVIIIASEINRINVNYSKRTILLSDTIPAKKREIIGFFEHLERA